jgi:hypothetical protein
MYYEVKTNETRNTVFSPWHIHLVLAMLGPRSTLGKQPPAAEGENLSSNSMRLHLLAGQHVVGPAGRNTRLLDHPLRNRQQQGDEPQEHELCITPKSKQMLENTVKMS